MGASCASAALFGILGTAAVKKGREKVVGFSVGGAPVVCVRLFDLVSLVLASAGTCVNSGRAPCVGSRGATHYPLASQDWRA